MDLRFEMPVVGSDDQDLGWLDRLLVNPRTREVTHVIVRSERLSEEVILALSEVEGSGGGRLRLRVSDGDIDHMPRYYDGRVSVMPAQRVEYLPTDAPSAGGVDAATALNVPRDAVEVGPDTTVTLVDRGIVTLIGLGTEDATNQVTGVVVRDGKRSPFVPAEWVAGFGLDGVRLSATREQLGGIVGSPGGPYLAGSGQSEDTGGKKAA